MSDSEEENFCFYGTALEPYDEDTFPKKRPITVEEQIATDQQGRRRFHGAFTGGFSAGFFNTVGSLEGWTPSEFKSSRDDKANTTLRNPEDYMDDEDLGEFGIAPQTVKATSDYANSKKRKKQVWSDGPIPGEPVLETLINSGNETIGYMLLKNMSLSHKVTKESQEICMPDKKVYGCEMPKTYEINRDQEEIDMVPEIYKEYLKNPKCNTFGLGYVGLDKSHLNLFHSTNLVVKERNNKKLSISGQAFGVGAFEDDDEDIYVKEDMEKYDFELTNEKTNKNVSKAEGKTVFDTFILSKQKLANNTFYPPPIIPHSFTGKHNIRRSRFEPVSDDAVEKEPKQMDASVRAKYLGEGTENKTYTPSRKIKNVSKSDILLNKIIDANKPKDNKVSKPSASNINVDSTDFLFDRFVSASEPEDPSNILEPVKPTETLHGTQEMRDAAKMKMYGPLTRVCLDWIPASLLCKRFNVPEPNSSDMDVQKNKKRTKHLIFEYQKHEEKVVLKPGLTTMETTTMEELNKINTIVEDSEISKTPVSPTEAVDTIPTVVTIDLNKEENKSTPLVINKDITEKINVSENKDLFKAIFLSDSESEAEVERKSEEETEKEDRIQVIRENILTSELVPKIKPRKDGILTNIDYTQFQSVADTKDNASVKESASVEVTKVINDDDFTFGPKLPDKISKSANVVQSITIDNEWVEKDELIKKSHKHKHKNKKEKHKDKAGRSGHKKKRKHHKR